MVQTPWRWDDRHWENMFFKRVPQGWVLSLPLGMLWPWDLSRGRHYLLSETQKDKVAAILRGDWRSVVLQTSVPILFLISLLFVLDYNPALWEVAPLVFLVGLCAAGPLVNLWLWWLLRPILAGAQPTSQRIAFSERLQAYAVMVPNGFLIFYALLFGAIFAVAVVLTIMANRWDIDALISIALFGCLTWFALTLLSIKRKMTGVQSHET